MFVSLFFGIIGNLCTINILNFHMMVLGRTLFGVSVGLYTSIMPRMIEETFPLHLLSTMLSGSGCASNFATFLSFFMGALLPNDKDTDALVETDRWLIFLIYVPITLQLVFFLSLVFIIKYEPIKFLIK